MGPICCPETSVNNYHTTPRNIPQECSSQLKFTLRVNIFLMSFSVQKYKMTIKRKNGEDCIQRKNLNSMPWFKKFINLPPPPPPPPAKLRLHRITIAFLNLCVSLCVTTNFIGFLFPKFQVPYLFVYNLSSTKSHISQKLRFTDVLRHTVWKPLIQQEVWAPGQVWTLRRWE
jgi:hypothetical protein